MQISRYKILFVFMLLALACSKEMLGPDDIQVQQDLQDGQCFFATRETMADSETKATFDNGISWEVNDEIAVSDGKNQSIFVATAVDVSGKATFTLKNGEAPLRTSGVTYKAWYPKDIAPDKTSGIMTRSQLTVNANGEIPSGKNINYSPSIYTSNPMYCESTTSTLSFKNLCGLLKITYDSAGYDFALHRMIFESPSLPLWGDYTVSDEKMVLSNATAEYRRAELKNTNAKYVMKSSVNYVTTYYFALPAGAYKDLSFLSLSNSDSKKRFTTQINSLKDGETLNVERNKVYSIKIIIEDPRTDLSRNDMTANCYAIASKGVYMFRATRGNETDIIPDIDHVDVLWRAQEWNSINLKGKIVDNLSYRNGYILFSADGSQGNAVVAAYDSSNKILWSWHIWSLESSRALGEVTIDGVTYLDRNIGALYSSYYCPDTYTSSVLSSGYLYQWGRKDPFPGRGQEGSTGAVIRMIDKIDNVLGTAETSGQKRSTTPPTMAGPVKVEATVANPHKFVTVSSSNSHWASDIADTWGGNAKTIYDPCPFGYRVPASTDFKNWNTTYVTPYEAACSGTNTSVHGFNFTDGDSNTTFIPITGQLSYASGKFSGGYLGTNSSTSSNVETYGRVWTRDSDHRIYQVNQKITAGSTWANRANTVSSFANKSAYGMAVRCVKDSTK